MPQSVECDPMQYDDLYLHIDGERLTGGGRRTIPVINPSTEETLGELPLASREDLDRALSSSARAFSLWRHVSAYDRAKIMSRAGELLRERRDHLANLMTLEQGKTLPESKMEVANLPDIIDWDAEEGRRTYGRVIPARVAHQ